MFDALSEKLQSVFARFRERGVLTESNIEDGLREVRLGLLEADVHYKVVKDFVAAVKARAVGEEVIKSVTPGQQIVKIVHDELVTLMGPAAAPLDLGGAAPVVIMLCGLQGSGKTTTVAKLGRLLAAQGRRPMLVAADLQRPAAVEQLQTLGAQVNLPVFHLPALRPVALAEAAIRKAAGDGLDTVLLDTAGRLHVDEPLMRELKEMAGRAKPREILLVCDAMSGQDALTSASKFHEALHLTGVILTKMDGDARGGAALSVKAVTGVPIKFAGVGERVDQLESFYPDRVASRILGMGDVVSLVERARMAVDEEKSKDLEEKFWKNSFNFEDFLTQLEQVKKMGPLQEIIGMIPGLGAKASALEGSEKQFARFEAIVRSMTPDERRRPDIIDGSRRKRIAAGSGVAVQDVNQLIHSFRDMKRAMKMMAGAGKGRGGFPGLPKGLLRKR
ncbi:MAG: signal recognition particle protein [Planctomycetota bacterium]